MKQQLPIQNVFRRVPGVHVRAHGPAGAAALPDDDGPVLEPELSAAGDAAAARGNVLRGLHAYHARSLG